jgi:hypothetical protein
MEGALIVISVVSPISSFICCYFCFNHGQLPCINFSSPIAPVLSNNPINESTTHRSADMSDDGDIHYI